MFYYTPSKIDRKNGKITFLINNNIETEIDIVKDFSEYVLLTSPNIDKYFVDLNNNSLIIIENHNNLMKSLREPTLGYINYEDKYYRPAILSDIDRNEEQYNSDNWKLYQYLKSIHDNI